MPTSSLFTKLILAGYALLVAGLPLAGLGYALLGSLGMAGPLSQGPTLDHWRALGTDGSLLASALFSGWVALAVVIVSAGLALAFVLRGQATLAGRLYPGLLYVPLLLPPLVVGFYFFQLLSGAGWLSRISFQLGLTGSPAGFPELVQDRAGLGIIGAYVLLTFPFFTLLLQDIYRDSRLSDYQQLTQTLGASAAQFRRRVAAPLLLRRAAPTLLLSAVAVAGAYDVPLLLGRPYPQMLSVFIATRLQRFDLRELPAAYLAGFVVALGLLGLISVVIRFRQRATSEGL